MFATPQLIESLRDAARAAELQLQVARAAIHESRPEVALCAIYEAEKITAAMQDRIASHPPSPIRNPKSPTCPCRRSPCS